MTREALLKDPVYWTTGLQTELYRQIDSFMKSHGLSKTQFAEMLGCSKSYVSQLLSGDYDHKISKFFELSLAVGKIPQISFVDVDEYIYCDSHQKVLEIPSNSRMIYRPEHSPIEEAA